MPRTSSHRVKKLPLALLFLSACLVGAGCRKKPAAPTGPGKPATEVAPALGISTNALPSHAILYEAITKHMTANQGRAAKDVEDLVAKGFLKPLPPLPPGKRYHLDQRSAVLSIVD